jgi:hypothetical protein
VTDTTLGDFIYITDVQLEAGSVRTQFERKKYREELADCQRYHYKCMESSGNAPFAVGTMNSTTEFRGVSFLPVPMRGAITLTNSTIGSMFVQLSAGNATPSAISINAYTPQTCWIHVTTGATTAGQGANLIGPASSGFVAYTSEL